jgi:hypothetical protein
MADPLVELWRSVNGWPPRPAECAAEVLDRLRADVVTRTSNGQMRLGPNH